LSAKVKTTRVKLSYTPAQEEIFFQSKARRRIITKGRRLGFTRGGSQAFIEYMLEKPSALLWGDTVNGNIDRYIERYWHPVLKQLPRDVWQYKKQEKKMLIGDSYCDFRSADNPENWEGFGYDYILLNEAGIILKNPYLYENAVRPMLLDNPESILIAGGTPKGKTPPVFYELWRRGMDGQKDFQSFQFSTYDNPYLTQQEIDDLIEEMSDEVVAQEVYGEFTDTTEFQFIEGLIIQNAIDRELHPSVYDKETKILGVDIAGSGADCTVLYKRQGRQTIGIERRRGIPGDVIVNLVATTINEWQPDAVFIDAGFNPAVIDILRNDLGHDVTRVDFAGRVDSPNYLNKRAEMWARMRDWLASGGSIPNDAILRKELQQQTYEFAKKDGSCVKLTSKEDMRKDGLKSPDIADALALTFAFPVKKKTLADTLLLNTQHEEYNQEYDMYA
jgi:hypothetical protein